jgi:protein-S-isoprenylcysteine O-methyltransferase Ste14
MTRGEISKRGLVLFLLLAGALSSLIASVSAAAGQGTSSAGSATVVLAGCSAAAYLAAAAGVIWLLLPAGWFVRLVAGAAVGSLSSLLLAFSGWMLVPAAAGLLLLWGIVRKGWAADAAPTDSTAAVYPAFGVPVPWLFVLSYLAGAALERVWPPPARPAGIILAGQVVGAVLLTLGMALAIWSLTLFRRARTTTIPGQVSSQLVTVGPYRFSRNPMYVALSLAYLGEAGLLAQIWPVLLLPLTVAYLHRHIIPVEETLLLKQFGERYASYCATVRRWI